MSGLRLWLRRASAAAAVILLLMLAVQCINLYQTGMSPENLDENGVLLSPVYTWAAVAHRLQAIAVPCMVCAGVIVLTLAVHAGQPCPAGKTGLSPANRLRLMKMRTAVLPAAALQEEKFRRFSAASQNG